MSQFVVDLNEPEEPGYQKPETDLTPPSKPREKSGCGRFVSIAGLVLLVVAFVGVIIGYFYWQSVKAAPEYSLAMLVDAARRNDQKAIDELVDTDAVVDDFLPQITDKAIELYGRGFPPEKIARVKSFAAPLMPAIKQRARIEVPRVIQEKTEKFKQVPYWAIALGAGQFLDIKTNGDDATIVSKIAERPFELKMKRVGDKWKVVAIKDDVLARRIAEKVGQEMIALSAKDGLKKLSDGLNVPSLESIKKKVEDLFK